MDYYMSIVSNQKELSISIQSFKEGILHILRVLSLSKVQDFRNIQLPPFFFKTIYSKISKV